MSSSGCILRCRVAGVIFKCRLALYFEVSCSRGYFRCRLMVYFEVSCSSFIFRCRLAGVL